MPEATDQAAQELALNPWAAPEVGHRNKIGGTPEFLQKPDWPSCPCCADKMSFYGQLDSINDADGQYDIADCGLIYVFFCFDCNKAEAIVQS